MATKSKVTLHPSYEVGEISPRLFSAYLEPSLRGGVHGYLYNPNHPKADEQGFRQDIIDSLKESGVVAARIPGGNFVSCWDWKDSIGPKDMRKANLELAWLWIYPNDVGHDEYLQWAEKVGFEPLYTINLGTGDINDAIRIIDYTNVEGGTYWSNLRKQNGHAAPYDVKIWYLGNEVDGPWQLGAWEKDPKGYGIKVHEISKAMKFVDGTIETVVCGSAVASLPHFPQWDLDVLEQCYETVDYVSLHPYHIAPVGDIGAYLGASEMFEDYLNTELAVCDFVKSKLRAHNTMMISVDEWGCMFQPKRPSHYGVNGVLHVGEDYCEALEVKEKRNFKLPDPDTWKGQGHFRGGSEILTAIASASMMISFIRHADRVKIGCMTSGFTTLATADTEEIWKTASYYPYKQLIDLAKGTSILPSIESETYDIPNYATSNFHEYDDHFGVKFIESAAAYNKDAEELNVFIINRDWNDDSELTLDTKGFEGYKFIEQIELYSDDLEARTTRENQNVIVPKISENAKFENGTVATTVKKLSWNVFRFKKI